MRRWDDKGLRFIGDLYHPDTGRIYSKQDLASVYGIRMTFLCYQALTRSLPKQLQKQVDIVHLKQPNIPYKINLVLNYKNLTKLAYRKFVEKMNTNNNSSNERLREKWLNSIGDYTEGTMQKVAKSIVPTYLIYLHFRIINRIYATNRYLYKIKTVEFETCTFCKETPETIVHLFWDCPVTNIFIKEILSRLKEKYSTSLKLNPTNWFLLTDLSNVEVLIVTLIKAHIHKSRLKVSKPSAEVMIQNIKFEVTKDYHIAKRDNNEKAFEQRWGELQKLLN